jgi:hypothetical protein
LSRNGENRAFRERKMSTENSWGYLCHICKIWPVIICMTWFESWSHQNTNGQYVRSASTILDAICKKRRITEICNWICIPRSDCRVYQNANGEHSSYAKCNPQWDLWETASSRNL